MAKPGNRAGRKIGEIAPGKVYVRLTAVCGIMPWDIPYKMTAPMLVSYTQSLSDVQEQMAQPGLEGIWKIIEALLKSFGKKSPIG